MFLSMGIYSLRKSKKAALGSRRLFEKENGEYA
jgi:hypothetical protein